MALQLCDISQGLEGEPGASTPGFLVGGHMEDVTIPGEPKPTDSSLIRTLTLVASGLTAASVAVNLMLQVAHHLRKRPVGPDQRDRIANAALALKLLKHTPPLVKQVRLFMNEIRKPA
jgi:hypothetical protein